MIKPNNSKINITFYYKYTNKILFYTQLLEFIYFRKIESTISVLIPKIVFSHSGHVEHTEFH